MRNAECNVVRRACPCLLGFICAIIKSLPRSSDRRRYRIFLLSPANTGGERAKLLLNERATFDLAARLRRQGASLGEIYSFVSGLYFRGKLAYASRFAAPPPGLPGSLVIAPGRGLVPPDTATNIEQLREIASVPVDLRFEEYRSALERDARKLSELAGPASEVVLLGSVATAKYSDPLLEIFGERLLFPVEFVGRGDMSRGGLMLRAARAGAELAYVPLASAVRHGPRPPKLPRY